MMNEPGMFEKAKRRDELGLMYEVLTGAIRPSKVSNIANISFLNYKITMKYLDKAVERGLVSENGDATYSATDMGILFINRYRYIQSVEDTIQGKRREFKDIFGIDLPKLDNVPPIKNGKETSKEYRAASPMRKQWKK